MAVVTMRSTYMRAGFLLVEIMIALTLFSGAAAVMAHFYWRSVATTHEAQRYLVGNNTCT